MQGALLDVVRFWLERGVDGFRLDTINFYFHDKDLRSNPALPKDQRDASIAPSVNPYNHQLHLYSKNQPENLAFLERFRAVLEEYDSTTAVGEVGDAQMGLEIMGQYTTGDERVHMCYSFELLSATIPTAARIAKVMGDVDRLVSDGWACWAFSNHDVIRHMTRWNLSDPAARALTTLMMCLRGSTCIYQGEELGLTEADVAFEDLQDPYGIEFWPEFKGRDGCRTPMAWEGSNQNAGFSTGTSWLPVSPDHTRAAAALQENDPDAMLHHYRRAIALRKAHPALQKGDHDSVKSAGDVVYFTRHHKDAHIFCAVNLSDTATTHKMPEGTWTTIGADLGSVAPIAGTLHLGPWQVALARRT